MLKIGRETTDLDFLLTNMHVGKDEIKEKIKEIITSGSEDGFSYSCEGIELLEQPHMEYYGYRVTLNVAFGHMKDKIHIDVGVGDIVLPTLRTLHLFQHKGKSLFEGEISLLVYPPEAIFAEKLETILSKGAVNSRMKDYHDLLLLTREPYMIDFAKLQASIKATCANRGTPLEFIAFAEDEIKSMNRLWTAHLKNLKNPASELKLPQEIQEVITEINRVIKNIAA